MNTVTVVTHNGRFHADDVFAVATISLLLEKSDFPAWRGKEISIIRTRDPEQFKRGTFVVDVGDIYKEEDNRFDHHQLGGAGVRKNGIPYAAFGLVWKKFGEHITGSKAVAEMIDAKLVQSIDAHDNGFMISAQTVKGVDPYLLEDFIFSFYPTWKENVDTFDGSFSKLVPIARALLEREIHQAKAKEEGYVIANETYAETEDKRLITFDTYVPWKDVLTRYPEPLFVVYPADQVWHVRTVASSIGRVFKNRKDLPASWAGKREAELAAVSGVPDAVFCHNKLFLAVARSREGAIALAKKALSA